ncbi:MAG: altronate dehydratase family protein [Clostridiales bacterium]|nr:altronate dehydratase family protein [Clostridiales bacterium]
MTGGAVKINAADTVAVAMADLPMGREFFGAVLRERVPKGHKFALTDIKSGGDVIKYGYSIGKAAGDIAAGEWVHTHNLRTGLDENLKYSYKKKPPVKFDFSDAHRPQIEVYERAGGRVGIRNELWVVPTVGCVNAQARQIAREFNARHKDLLVDGVFHFGHPYGCSQIGRDHERAKTTLQQIVCHPNAGGVLVLGLGCENNRIADFREGLKKYGGDRAQFLNAQDAGDEIEEGVKLLEKLYETAKNDRRTARGMDALTVGLKCGGSDGLSGITANPLLGLFSDYLTDLGGAAALTEVPEMFGAEQILMERAKDKKVFDKTVNLINGFKDYFRQNGQAIYENPSPGNKDGGISTLEDKSLGCVQKGGASEIADALFAGDTVKGAGLVLLDGPGNDMAACTNLGAAGCQMILFTTGRGTPLGSFVPTVKVSTNDALAERKSRWIDFNAGGMTGGGRAAILNDFIDLIAETASGRRTRNELNDSREIALFKTGVTL